MKSVTIIETNIANIASVRAAFERFGLNVLQSSDPKIILDSDYVVLPGVGTFGAGIEALNSAKLTDIIRQRISDNKPTLAICLGMQLLFETCEESPGVKGLGIFNGSIKKLNTSLPLPHLSWQPVKADQGFSESPRGWAYFAHSYAVTDAPTDSEVLTANYGQSFVAAFRKGKLLACQFHPELSGQFGKTLLQGWLS